MDDTLPAELYTKASRYLIIYIKKNRNWFIYTKLQELKQSRFDNFFWKNLWWNRRILTSFKCLNGWLNSSYSTVWIFIIQIAHSIFNRVIFFILNYFGKCFSTHIKDEYYHDCRTLIPAPGRAGRGLTHTQTNRPWYN